MSDGEPEEFIKRGEVGLPASEMQRFNVTLNNAIRRIFGFRRWESICQLRQCYKLNSKEVMMAIEKKRFLCSIANHSNSMLRTLYAFTRVE